MWADCDEKGINDTNQDRKEMCVVIWHIRTHTGLGLTTVVLLGVLHLKLMWLCKNFSKKNER